ncbi:hypothetical protein [Microbacterium sp. 22242]|uniref:hypothetical protein n=1 Tax=Microbacterium sp. 22242 TaxID=3453896 RepID=UPI003F873412
MISAAGSETGAVRGPMSFTKADIRRGALWAWLIFISLLEALFLALTVHNALSASPPEGSSSGIPAAATAQAIGSALVAAGIYSALVGLVGGAVSGVVTLLILPLAGRLASWMAPVRAAGAYVVAYGLLGAVTGAAVGSALSALLFSGAPVVVLVVGSVAALLTGLASAGGWLIAARRARRGRATHR